MLKGEVGGERESVGVLAVESCFCAASGPPVRTVDPRQTRRTIDSALPHREKRFFLVFVSPPETRGETVGFPLSLPCDI